MKNAQYLPMQLLPVPDEEWGGTQTQVALKFMERKIPKRGQSRDSSGIQSELSSKEVSSSEEARSDTVEGGPGSGGSGVEGESAFFAEGGRGIVSFAAMVEEEISVR